MIISVRRSAVKVTVQRGRPLKFFEDEDTDAHFFCQRVGCGKRCEKHEENWVRYGDLIIRVCDICYQNYYA